MQGIIAEYERAKFMERSRRGRRHAAQRPQKNDGLQSKEPPQPPIGEFGPHFHERDVISVVVGEQRIGVADAERRRYRVEP